MRFSNPQIRALLSKYYPFLGEGELDTFLSITTYSIFKNREIILKSGGIEKTVFIILKGSARAYSINKDGVELNDHLRSDGFLFGDSRVLGNETQILDIEAIGEIHILKFNIAELELLGFDNPKIMKFYLGLLKEIILTFSHRINTFVTLSSKERYDDLIKWNPLYLKTTYDKHLASFLGITPLTLYRIKNRK